MSSVEVLKQVVEQETAERSTLAKFEQIASQLAAEVRGDDGDPFIIENDEDFDWATDMHAFANEQVKNIEARRKTVTQPMHEALEAFRALYRPTLNAYKDVRQLLRKKIMDYDLEKRKAEREAMRKIAKASQKGDFDKAMEVSSSIERAPDKKGVSISVEWTYEEVDIDKVPEEYVLKMVDPLKMSKYIKKFKGGEPKAIPGIRFVEYGSRLTNTKGK